MPNAVPAGAGEGRRATLAVAAGAAALAVAATLPQAIEPSVLAGRGRVGPRAARVDPGRRRRPRLPHRVDAARLVPARLARAGGRASRSRRSASSPSCSRRALAGLTVVYARRFLPLWLAGLAGVLTALAWQVVEHGSELRAYALLAFLTLVFALLLERAAERPTLGPPRGARRRARRRARTRTTSSSSPPARRCSGSLLERDLRPVALRVGAATVARHRDASRLAPGPRRPGERRALRLDRRLRPAEARLPALGALLGPRDDVRGARLRPRRLGGVRPVRDPRARPRRAARSSPPRSLGPPLRAPRARARCSSPGSPGSLGSASSPGATSSA